VAGTRSYSRAYITHYRSASNSRFGLALLFVCCNACQESRVRLVMHIERAYVNKRIHMLPSLLFQIGRCCLRWHQAGFTVLCPGFIISEPGTRLAPVGVKPASHLTGGSIPSFPFELHNSSLLVREGNLLLFAESGFGEITNKPGNLRQSRASYKGRLKTSYFSLSTLGSNIKVIVRGSERNISGRPSVALEGNLAGTYNEPDY